MPDVTTSRHPGQPASDTDSPAKEWLFSRLTVLYEDCLFRADTLMPGEKAERDEYLHTAAALADLIDAAA